MNSQDLQKLKFLIQSSKILSDSEKAEWTQLLELMDDKQLLELQKILTSGQHVTFGNKPPLAQMNPVAKPKPVSSLPTPVPDVVPKLSHILNMPRIGQSSSEIQNRPIISPAQSTKAQAQQKTGFSQHLNEVLQEKELPSGPVSKPVLDLPAAQPVAQPKPQPAPLPRPNAPVIPKPKILPEASLNKIKLAPPLKSFATAPIDQSISNVHPVGLQGLPKAVSLNSFSPAMEKPVVAKLQLNSISDLSKMDSQNFNIEDFGLMIKQIKLLETGNDIHEILFNIEQSPLHQAYIRTGQEILQKQTNFENLEEQPGYLSRRQFEAFADLLRHVQAG